MDTPSKRTYAENLALAKARGAAAKKATAKAPVAKQLSLELWPDAVRGVPNAVLRGAIFGVSQRRKTHKKRTVIASVEGYEIRFKGETFNQTDLDLWEMLLHLARLQPLDTQVEFTAHSLLKELGRGTSGKHHEELKEQLMRLIGGVVEITWTKEQKAYAGNLISGYARDDVTGRYVVRFNADTAKLYGVGNTLIDWSERQALGNNSLAKWLHGFFASHAKPFPYKVETIFNLCGSTTERLGDFRKLLRTALVQLVEVGAIKAWSINPKTDLVEVVNFPSQTQLKHLAQKTTKRKLAVISKKLTKG
jgi:hypothetical protein